MAVVQISADAPVWIHVAADWARTLHIGGGALGIISGAAALVFRKGEPMHRLAGNVFFVSMLTMSGIGAVMAPLLPETLSALAGIFTFYLVATSWATVRRPEGTIGRFETVALMVALTVVVMNIGFGQLAETLPKRRLDGYPPEGHYILAGLVGFAAFLDLSVILRGGISGAQRIARHLWRMCLALWIAAGSFFLGQAQLLPLWFRQAQLHFVPEILILLALVYWLIRVLFTRWVEGASTEQLPAAVSLRASDGGGG